MQLESIINVASTQLLMKINFVICLLTKFRITIIKKVYLIIFLTGKYYFTCAINLTESKSIS